jgi:hypothetical protein
MYCNIENYVPQHRKNMQCNIEKICSATSKNMYYNIENYVLQYRKLCTAIFQIVVPQHRKSIYYNDPKNPIATFKNHLLHHPKKPIATWEKTAKTYKQQMGWVRGAGCSSPMPNHLRVRQREEGIGPKARRNPSHRCIPQI